MMELVPIGVVSLGMVDLRLGVSLEDLSDLRGKLRRRQAHSDDHEHGRLHAGALVDQVGGDAPEAVACFEHRLSELAGAEQTHLLWAVERCCALDVHAANWLTAPISR
ncbi:MAG: hypothetical protein AAB134_02270 [Pseudomonadota bacterium]